MNRDYIEGCLQRAAEKLRAERSISVDPVIDRDTSGVPGAPDIAATIFDKIEHSSVFVADVSIIQNPDGGRPCPNPNVLIELGYALRALGWPRMGLVLNTAFGAPEQLPFDLRHRRLVRYSLHPEGDHESDHADELVGDLASNLKLAFHSNADVDKRMLSLELRYDEVREDTDIHEYRLRPLVRNDDTRPLEKFHLDIEFPRDVIPESNYGAEVKDRLTSTHRVFRFRNNRNVKSPVFPGDTKEITTIPYFVNQEIFDGDILSRKLRATLFAEGLEPIVVEGEMRQFQDF